MDQPSNIQAARDLEAWLRQASHSNANAVASRLALRVLPITVQAEKHGSTDLVLHAFHAAFIAWAAVTYRRELGDTALAADRALASFSSRSEDRAVTSATQALRGSSLAIAGLDKPDITGAAGAASEAVRLVSDEQGMEEFWHSITADVDWSRRRKGQNLARQPLWLNDVRGNHNYQANFPPWARRPFDAFADSALVRSGSWGVWTRVVPRDITEQPESTAPESLRRKDRYSACDAKTELLGARSRTSDGRHRRADRLASGQGWNDDNDA